MRPRDPIWPTSIVADFEGRFALLVSEVDRKGTRGLTKRSGVPGAALVAADDLERLAEIAREREDRRRLLARLRVPFRQIPPEQIERDVAEIIADVRAAIDAKPGPAATEG